MTACAVRSIMDTRVASDLRVVEGCGKYCRGTARFLTGSSGSVRSGSLDLKVVDRRLALFQLVKFTRAAGGGS